MTESPLKNLEQLLALVFKALSSSVQTWTAFTESRDSHLANKPVFVHWSSLLSCARSRCLRPHLLHVLQYHIAMSIKCLHASQQLSVVSAGDQDLGVRSDGGLKD